jgi:IclR family mhp operon transcriptional activator
MNNADDPSGGDVVVYRDVRALRRGLEIIEALSRTGWLRPTDLAKITGIDRSTIYRIVNTLEDKGFAARRREDGAIALTSKLRVIADGVRREEVFLEQCSDELASLTQDISWPSDLALFAAGQVTIQDSTHSLSPITFHRATILQPRSLFATALGKGIMMMMTPSELSTAIDIAISNGGPDDGLSIDRSALDGTIREYARLGYAWAAGAVDPNVSSIALGFRQRCGLIGSVNIVFFRRVLSPEEAASRYLPRLKECVSRLAEI